MDTTQKATVTKQEVERAEREFGANTIALNRQAAMNWHIKTYGTTYVPRPQWSKPELEQTASVIFKRGA